MKILPLALLLPFCLSAIASAAPVSWEYLAQNYDNQAAFMKAAQDLGAQGWELAACPTTGSSNYLGSIAGTMSGSLDGQIGRSVYCIFKRPIGN